MPLTPLAGAGPNSGLTRDLSQARTACLEDLLGAELGELLDDGLGDAGKRLGAIVIAPTFGAWTGRPGHVVPGPVLLYGPSAKARQELVEFVASRLDAPLVTADVRGPIDRPLLESCPALTDGPTWAPAVVQLEGLGDCLGEPGSTVASSPKVRLARLRLARLQAALARQSPARRPLVMAGTAAPWTLPVDWFGAARFDRLIHVPPVEPDRWAQQVRPWAQVMARRGRTDDLSRWMSLPY